MPKRNGADRQPSRTAYDAARLEIGDEQDTGRATSVGSVPHLCLDGAQRPPDDSPNAGVEVCW